VVNVDLNLTNGQYIVDHKCDIDLSSFGENSVWDISDLEEEEILNIDNTSSKNIDLPFLGTVSISSSGEIDQLSVSDPLMQYGTRRVRLRRSINTQAPEPELISSGYTIVLAPEEIDQVALNQLPIRPDSIKVSIEVVIKDSQWSDNRLRYKASNLDHQSFLRQMDIERKVEIKVEPFGWTPVNSVAPMIDWDRSSTIEHRYFIIKELPIPYAIIEKRDGIYNVSVLDFNRSGDSVTATLGPPQIKALPNPVINDVRFEITNVPAGIYVIKIKNILGEIKIQKTVQLSMADIFPVKIDNLRKGSYFYVLEDDQGNVLSTKRLIVLKP